MLLATSLPRRLLDHPAVRIAVRLVVAVVLGAVATAVLTLAFALPLSRHPGFLFNSDLLQPFLVAKDALRDPASVFDWRHSPSAYVVPDMLLAAFCTALPLPGLLRPLAYGGLLLLLDCLAVGWLLRATKRTRTVLGGAFAMAGIFVVLMLGLSFLPVDVGFNMVVSLAAPFIHTGAILLGISLLAALVAHVTTPTRFSIVPVLLISVAGGYSDLLFVVWFVAPAVIAVILAGSRFKPRLADLFLVSIVALGCAMLDRYLRPGTTITIVDHALSVRNWIGWLVTSVQQGLWLFPASVVMGAVMGVRGLQLIAASRKRPISSWNLAEVAFGGTQAVAVLLPVLSGTLDVMTNLRYGLVAFILPVVWLLGLVAPVVAPRRALAAGLASATVVLFGALLPASIDAAARDAAPTPIAQCLQAHGLTTGYADYWTAKRNMLQTDYRLHLVQLLDTDGRPYAFNFNQRGFFGRADTGAPLNLNFIVTTGLRPETLVPLYGDPDRTLDCGGETVWLYDNPLPQPIEVAG